MYMAGLCCWPREPRTSGALYSPRSLPRNLRVVSSYVSLETDGPFVQNPLDAILILSINPAQGTEDEKF